MLQNLALNADVGEGSSNDAQLMHFLTRCSIASGGHAGNRETIDQTIDLALNSHVKVGAHPSYPDQENFGRADLQVSQEDLMESLAAQVHLILDRCRKKEVVLDHIKPHGKFYNDLFHDHNLAFAWLNLLEQILEKRVYILVAYQSAVHKEAKKRNYPYLIEAFADRNYNDDGSLVSRQLPNAMITDKSAFKNRLLHLANRQQIMSVNHKPIDIKFDTLCVHSDSDRIVDHLKFALA